MRPTRYYSNKQEKQIARTIDGKQQINSGATPLYKGDVRSKHFLVEAKTTTEEKKSFAIKKDWLDTIEKEAFADRKIPVVAFRFEPDGKDYYIINETTLKQFIHFLEENHE